MNGGEVLKAAFGMNHFMANAVIGDVTADAGAKKVGGNVQDINRILVHAVTAEDFFVQGVVKGGPLIWQSGGWEQKAGFTLPQSPALSEELLAGITFDLAKFTPYAQAVFAATEAYVGGLSDADLGREIDTKIMGKQPLGQFLSGVGLSHGAGHFGEIAALKGIQGLKGLPF